MKQARPSQPLKCSRPPCSTPPRCQVLDVSHINICTCILRRVTYVWLQTSSVDLISALPSLPPFCTFSINASTSDCVPHWQQGRCLAFTQSTWEWHVQVRNEATSEQEDDLGHTGQTYFSHSQRQPVHLNGASVQARQISRASSPSIHLKCYSYEGLQADVTSGILLWAWFWVYRCLLQVNWTLCPYQLGGWHASCQWQGIKLLDDHRLEISNASDKMQQCPSQFFLLHAAKVRSSCEEGPGQSALQTAYHNPKLETKLNWSKTEHLKSFRPKIANKQIKTNQLIRRRKWQKSVGSKLVQGEDRKERVANRGALPVTEELKQSSQPGRACSEEPVG